MNKINPKVSQELINNIESAIADIQLFGTQKQIELANDFSKGLAIKESANLDNLLITIKRRFKN